MDKYIIGATLYDSDNMLWETKISLNDKKKTLIASAWGKNESESLKMAEIIVSNLK